MGTGIRADMTWRQRHGGFDLIGYASRSGFAKPLIQTEALKRLQANQVAEVGIAVPGAGRSAEAHQLFVDHAFKAWWEAPDSLRLRHQRCSGGP